MNPGQHDDDDSLRQHTSGTGFSCNILVKDTNLTVTGPIGKYVSKAASGRDVRSMLMSSIISTINALHR